MSASTLETCTAATAPIRFPAQQPPIGIPGVAVGLSVLSADLRSGGEKKKRDLSEVPGGRENGEGALKWICGL